MKQKAKSKYGRKKWTAEETEVVRQWYAKLGADKTRRLLLRKGYYRTNKAICDYATRVGIKCDITGFQPGNQYARRRKSNGSAENLLALNNARRLEIGAIVDRADKGAMMILVSRTPKRWRTLQYEVWEQHTGEVINHATHVIRFKDGDYRNTAFDNLVKLTRSESYHKTLDYESWHNAICTAAKTRKTRAEVKEEKRKAYIRENGVRVAYANALI